MVEERKVRADLAAEGIADPDVFTISARVQANHKGDVTHAEQSRLRAESEAVAQQARFLRERLWEEATQAAIIALREIRDGHNDPRALAAKVLAVLDARLDG